MTSEAGGKVTSEEMHLKHQQLLKRQRQALAIRMKKLAAKQAEISKKTNAAKEKLRKKYEDMKSLLDEDLRITLTQLDAEQEATEALVEERTESCHRLTQELDQQLSNAGARTETQELGIQNTDTEKRIFETLKLTDPDLIQIDEFKSEQLLGLTTNLLLFIRSQVPVTKKLFQSYAAGVVLDADTAHPKLIISPKGDSVTYTNAWQVVPESPLRFDNTLNVASLHCFSEGRQYWEVEVSGKTYWEMGLTYPSIPRKGPEEESWLGRGSESWSVEYFKGDYTAWHGGVQHELPRVAGKRFTRIGVYSSFPGGLVCFIGADTMTPLHCFCAGTFTETLHQALCPGHDNGDTNWKSLKICDVSRSAPVL